MITKYLDMYKVLPRIPYHDYTKHNFYIYCYIDPFTKKYQKYNIAGEEFNFAYRPIYIGKASNKGFRHAQHIPEFIKSGKEQEGNVKIYNALKRKTFQELENNMKINNNYELPKDWEEYKKNWIIILKVCNSQEELIQTEKDFIKGIGTIKKRTGPLVNAILG